MSSKKRLKLNLYGEESDYNSLLKCIDELKSNFASQGYKYSNLDIVNTALRQLNRNMVNLKTGALPTIECAKSNADETLVITTVSALENLSGIVCLHKQFCNELVCLTSEKKSGYSVQFNVSCVVCRFTRKWISSPVLPNKREIVNYRMTHAYLSSGVLPSHFERFSDATEFGKLPQTQMNGLIREYSACVELERKSSCASAFQQELASSSTDGIDIISDARHSTRENSKLTDVVCIGYSSHKVVDHIVVSRDDDTCSQRHELLGTKKLYENFDVKNVKIRRHGHDRNASINKFVREKQINTVNQNDTWHVSVSIEKEMKKIATGAKCREGKAWSSQLLDKI